MVAHKKAGVDWYSVRDRYESDYLAGNISLRQLAKDYGITHQSIMERAVRYQWPEKDSGKPIYSSKGKNRDKPVIDGSYKSTPDILESILSYLRQGLPEYIACDLVGITQKTLATWKNANEELMQQITQAKANCAYTRVQALNRAIAGGDSAMALRLLERTEYTAPAFRDNGSGNAQIRITIEGVAKPGTVLAKNETPIIDITPNNTDGDNPANSNLSVDNTLIDQP